MAAKKKAIKVTETPVQSELEKLGDKIVETLVSGLAEVEGHGPEKVYLVTIVGDSTIYGFVDDNLAKIVLYDYAEHNRNEQRLTQQVLLSMLKINEVVMCNDMAEFQDAREAYLVKQLSYKLTLEEREAVQLD